MEILNTSTEEYGVAVEAKSGEITKTFTVQLTDNTYRYDLGCWITTDSSDGDINEDDYPDFDVAEIIEVAEQHAQTGFEEQYTEKEIEFNCAINSCSVYMRIDNDTKEVDLIIKDSGYIGDYQRRYAETNKRFDSEQESLEYAGEFRTNDHQDINGLYNFIQEIQK